MDPELRGCQMTMTKETNNHFRIIRGLAARKIRESRTGSRKVVGVISKIAREAPSFRP